MTVVEGDCHALFIDFEQHAAHGVHTLGPVLLDDVPVVGDNIVITGPTTGAVMLTLSEIRVDLKPVEKAVKGDRFSIKTDVKIRPSDKLFLWRKVVPKTLNTHR